MKRNSDILEEDVPGFVSSLAKGLRILSAFERGELLGNQELVALTGMPKSTVSRLTGTLEALGYLQLNERTRKYQIGGRALRLGATVQRHIGLQRAARPILDALASELDVTMLLGTRERFSMAVLEIVRPSRSIVTLNAEAGEAIPMEITSLGLAYLVAAPTAERVHILEALRHRHEDEWERIRLDIERAHREYKELGYVVSRRASRGRLSGVGVPLQLGAQGIFTLSCLGVPSEFSRARVARTLGPTLVKAAHQLCETMASRAPQAPERATRKP